MGRERLTRGRERLTRGPERLTRGPSLALLLRLGLALGAAGLCAHLYLHTVSWSGATALAARSNGSRAEEESAEEGRARMSHTRMSHARMSHARMSHARTPREGSRSRDAHSALLPHRKSPRWHIDMEPWASESRSLEDEARRFLQYITTPQVPCLLEGGDWATLTDAAGAWAVCLDPQYSLIHRIKEKNCRVYSFGLGADDRSLELILVRSGCDVHCFDPGLKESHLQKAQMWLHRLSVDWRDPNPALVAQHQHANSKKLATILNDFGHRQVDVLKADMESAEWKILENLILEGVLASVGQLLLEVHLHWAGFEVPGDEPSVVRYWFSLLKELERANFRLFHVYSDPNKPQVFLHKNVLNASSSYTLSWVNIKWL